MTTFVGGFRSGSTLLINLLGLHSSVAPWFETKCLVEALRWIRVLTNPDTAEAELALATPRHIGGFSLDAVAARMRWHAQYSHERLEGLAATGKHAGERYPIGCDCVGYSMDKFASLIRVWRNAIGPSHADAVNVATHTGALILALGEAQVQSVGGHTWINKTPEMPRFGRELRLSLGDCRIVHMIRDGREVIRSASQLGWGKPEEIAYRWAGLIRQSRNAAAAAPSSYLEVRYEDLVSDPGATLSRVMSFLELPQDPTLRSRYESFGGTRIVSAKDLSTDAKWSHGNLAEHRHAIEIAKPLVVELG